MEGFLAFSEVPFAINLKNMEKTKIWLKRNWSTVLLVGLLGVLIVSPDAKAWFMRQIISTGIMNASVQDKKVMTAAEPGASETGVNLSVRDESGKIISTSDLKGKVVFINFWASWCPPCRAEFPSIQKFYEKYKGNPNVVFLTVNMDEQVAAGENYLQRGNYTVPLLVPAGDIPPAYFSGSLPTTLVLDKTGEIRLQHAGMADYSKASFYRQIDGLLAE